MKSKIVAFLLLAILGIVGAGLSVAMLISSVAFLEWGRVVLYSVTLAVCVEMAVLCISRLKSGKPKNNAE